MMPNKRNPDPAELVRGKTARVIGQLTSALVLLKGLPASYQRDLQEDKPPLFDGMATLESSLLVMAGLLDGLRIDTGAMREAAGEGHTTATAVADELVDLGVPFRAAHGIVGRLVAAAERDGVALTALSDATIRETLGDSDDETARALAGDAEVAGKLRGAASVDGAIARCDVVGGTAPARVAAELAAAAQRLGPG
jgi:argininosuccinate lyase